MIRLFRVALAMIILGAARAEAADGGMRLDYAFFAGGVRLLSFSAAIGLEPDRYAIEIAGGTRGWIDWLIGWRLTSLTEGARAAVLAPTLSVTENVFRGRNRMARLAYQPGMPVTTTLDPPPAEDDRDPVPPTETIGTIDVATALVGQALRFEAGGRCAPKVALFDGRRRFNALVSDGGGELLTPNEYAAYAGPAEKCLMRIERLAGYARRESEYDRAKDRDQTYRIWFARVLPDRPPVPVRLEGTGGMGDFVVHLIGARSTPTRPDLADVKLNSP